MGNGQGLARSSTISVVIPVRNLADLLAETLGSVLAQTRLASEVIVVDDGSDDDSVATAVASFSSVTVIRQQHLGTGAARNRGATATDSEAILFLDADDLLRPDALASLGAALDADTHIDLVHGRMHEFVDQRNPPPPGMRHTELDSGAARLAGSTLIRRTFWDRTGGMDEALPRGEWIDWMSRALGLGPKVAEVEGVVLDRRLHASNKSASAGDRTPYLAAVVRAAILRKRRDESAAAGGE